MSERDFQNGVVFQSSEESTDLRQGPLQGDWSKSHADRLMTSGGGVFKNGLTTTCIVRIVLAKAGEYWVFAYLFAKKDRAKHRMTTSSWLFGSLPNSIGARHRPSLMQKSGPAPYWRFAMATKRKFKSDAFEAIHSAVEDMYSAGTIDKETMKTFDETCLSIPQE